AEFASFKLGYMAWDAGDCGAAVPLLQAHAEAFPTGRHTAEARWFVARCRWKAGDPAGAVSAWDQLLAGDPGADLSAGATYWKARAAGRAGDRAAERAGLEAVLRRWPSTGYAWFAAERLGRTFPRADAV